MTTPASVIAGRFEMLLVGMLYLVGRVTVRACRTTRIALCQQLSMDALVVNFLNSDVALAAGIGHVGFVHRGTAIDAALDVMHSMAIIA